MKDERTDRRQQQCESNIGKTDKISDVHESISSQLPVNRLSIACHLILYARAPERDLFTNSCTEATVFGKWFSFRFPKRTATHSISSFLCNAAEIN